MFGLTMQLRRNATSVASRIAEGCGRNSSVEFAADLKRSIAAATELEYSVLLAKDLGLFAEHIAEALSQEVIAVRKMTLGLLRKLQTTSP